MKRLSELQYISRMGQDQSATEEPTHVGSPDEDIFGTEPALDEREFMSDTFVSDGAEVAPFNGYDNDPFTPIPSAPEQPAEDELNIPLTEANPFRRKPKREAKEGNVDSIDYKGYTITVHRNRGGMYTAKNDSGEPYMNVPQFKTAEEAIAWDKKNIDQMEESSTSDLPSLQEQARRVRRIEAESLARTYGCEWDKTDDSEWKLYDMDELVFTYIPKTEQLITDFDPEIVTELLSESGVDLEEQYAVYSKGGSIGAKNSKPIQVFDTAEEAKAFAARRRKQLTPGERKGYGMGYVVKPLKESSIDPRELMDPESEFYIGDENDEIMPSLDSVGNIRNTDNPYVAMETSLGKDAADFMRSYNNSPKQRMHKYLFDTHEWSPEDDQSDWEDAVEYFYGDLHDTFGEEEEWDDEVAREVATTHMYGHPRWDEKKYGLELKKALALYETAQAILRFAE